MPRFKANHIGSGMAASLLEGLRAQSREVLAELPASESLDATAGQKTAKVTVYRETLADGTIRIVVQTYEPRWFGIAAWVQADGFKVSLSGEHLSLLEAELYDFV